MCPMCLIIFRMTWLFSKFWWLKVANDVQGGAMEETGREGFYLKITALSKPPWNDNLGLQKLAFCSDTLFSWAMV